MGILKIVFFITAPIAGLTVAAFRLKHELPIAARLFGNYIGLSYVYQTCRSFTILNDFFGKKNITAIPSSKKITQIYSKTSQRRFEQQKSRDFQTILERSKFESFPRRFYERENYKLTESTIKQQLKIRLWKYTNPHYPKKPQQTALNEEINQEVKKIFLINLNCIFS